VAQRRRTAGPEVPEAEDLCGAPGGGAPAAAVAADAAQRAVALRCIAGACESGQLLVDVFVNFDCDLEGANLIERLARPNPNPSCDALGSECLARAPGRGRLLLLSNCVCWLACESADHRSRAPG